MFENEIQRLIRKEARIKDIVLEVPSNPEFGDYAFPCFQLAKVQKRNPMEVALELSEKMKPNEFIEKIVPKGPYVNFFIRRSYITELTLRSILRMKEKYGSSFVGRGYNALVEHTSINPNASPHVGRARGALIGDAMVRLLRFHGYEVEAHYFVNDIGKQIAMLVYAAGNKTPTFEGLLKFYIQANKKVKSSKKEEEKVFALLRQLEQGDKPIRKKFKKIVEICVQGQKKILSELGIKFEYFDYESEYLWNNALQDVIKKLERTKKVFVDEFGRKVLDLKEFNLPMKCPVLVLTRNDGTSLYGLRDIAYNMDKAKKAKGKNLLVLGEDQKLYAQQVSAALSLLKVHPPEVVHFAFVTIAGGKMATRSGEVVLLEEFINEAVKKAKNELKKRKVAMNNKLSRDIGHGAVKYAILKVSPEKNIAFDWDTALSFDGEAAPYIQYAHARASSIIRKAKIRTEQLNYTLIVSAEEMALINKLYQFSSIAQKAGEELRPHMIAVYAYQLAQEFNNFYHKCQVLTENEELTKVRFAMVIATRQVLANALSILGIAAPQKM